MLVLKYLTRRIQLYNFVKLVSLNCVIFFYTKIEELSLIDDNESKNKEIKVEILLFFIRKYFELFCYCIIHPSYRNYIRIRF
jgi:hypothetical protein